MLSFKAESQPLTSDGMEQGPDLQQSPGLERQQALERARLGIAKFLKDSLFHLVPSTEPLPTSYIHPSLNISTTTPGRPHHGPPNL